MFCCYPCDLIVLWTFRTCVVLGPESSICGDAWKALLVVTGVGVRLLWGALGRTRRQWEMEDGGVCILQLRFCATQEESCVLWHSAGVCGVTWQVSLFRQPCWPQMTKKFG